MIDDDSDLDPRYRAPRAFGPMPGPRNIPHSQCDATGSPPEQITTAVSVSLQAEPLELVRLLPPRTRLSGSAVLTATVTRFENLRWLAGRGYSILTVTCGIEYVGTTGDDVVRGTYLAVLWEGLADAVTTGRDELGFPKLPADISAPDIDDVSLTGGIDAAGRWGGFTFFDLTAADLLDAEPGEGSTPVGTIVHRYVPSLTTPGEADIDELLLHPVAVGRPTITHYREGLGCFTFHHAKFVDVPVQYPVINALAALSLSATGPAALVRSTGAPGGAPGAIAPRRLDSATRLPATELSR